MRVLHSAARLGLSGLFVALMLGLLVPGTVSAHERRDIANGQAQAVVGWLVEPSFVNEPNGVDFRVTKAGTTDPIEGLEKTVKVEVIQGATKKTLDLRARFGLKGAYTADVMPTVVGDYSFRFFGEINGVQIDEKFDSGPGRFDGVKSLQTVQFPTVQPTIGEMQAQVAAAQAAASTANTMAMIGIGVGLLGLLAGLGAFFLRGRGAGGQSVSSAAD